MPTTIDFGWMVAVQVTAFVAVCILVVWGAQRLVHLSRDYRERFDQTVGAHLERAHLFIDPARLLGLNALLVVSASVLAGWLSDQIVVAIAVAVCAGFMPRLTLSLLQSRRRERFRHQLPELMLLTAGGLRAGASLWQALAQTSTEMPHPMRQEIELMLREQRMGMPLERALSGLERRMPLEELKLMGAAFRIAQDTGGNLAETLEALSESTRRKLALEAKIRALTAQGRMQAWVMGLLPAVLALVLFQIEPVAMSALFTTSYGLLVCVLVAVLLLLGLHFVRRIVSIDI